MKRICIYVTLGLLGAVSAHAQEINIGQAVARKISDDKVYGKEPAAGEGQEMIRFNRKRDMLLEYNETVPAQEWMSGARVEIFRELQGCAGCGEALGNACLLYTSPSPRD